MGPFVPALEQVLAKWWEVYERERDLLDNQITAGAEVDYIAAAMDGTSSGVAFTLLIETKNNRKAPVFMRYYGTQQPNRFRRSVLGRKLAVMRT